MNEKNKKFIKITGITAIILIITGIILFWLLDLGSRLIRHPLNFQDMSKIKLEKPVNSVEEGYPYALKRAREWREDVVLTEVEIISSAIGTIDEIDDIEDRNEIIRYTFEFEYMNEKQPSGFILVYLNVKTNCIDMVSAYHDDNNLFSPKDELDPEAISDKIGKVYDAALKAIGKENILGSAGLYFSAKINSNFAVVSVYREIDNEEGNFENYEITIDMSTFEVTEMEIKEARREE
ncbi:MAG TPA: hypothetical protein PLG49_01245 [Defluviitaleaceae bacterium]|nr:hypothetical protein [Defluviitaleaceae bacterium]